MELRFFLLYWHLFQKIDMEKFVVMLVLLTLVIASCNNRKSNKEEVFMPYVKDTAHIEPDSLAKKELGAGELVEAVPQNRGVDLAHHYFIVIASYTIKDLAYKRVDDMKTFGFNANVFMQNNDGWHKLAIESYKTRNEAEIALKRVHQMGNPFDQARIVYNQ
jgi:hypothetical protein